MVCNCFIVWLTRSSCAHIVLHVCIPAPIMLIIKYCPPRWVSPLPTRLCILSQIDNNYYFLFYADNDYDVHGDTSTDRVHGESSLSLSNSCASSINIKKHAVVHVQHQYAACGPNKYLQPVSLNGTPTTSIQQLSSIVSTSVVYNVPIVHCDE